jgi:hypothetical protein
MTMENKQISWSINRIDDVLANGMCDLAYIKETIKNAKLHFPTAEEIAEKKRLRAEAWEKERKKMLKERKIRLEKEKLEKEKAAAEVPPIGPPLRAIPEGSDQPLRGKKLIKFLEKKENKKNDI